MSSIVVHTNSNAPRAKVKLLIGKTEISVIKKIIIPIPKYVFNLLEALYIIFNLFKLK